VVAGSKQEGISDTHLFISPRSSIKSSSIWYERTQFLWYSTWNKVIK